VLSGVSGIESQSLKAWEKVKANRNQALLFINKLDLAGADYRKVMEQIEVMFRVKPVALTLPVYMDGLDGVVDVLNQLALYRSVENPRKLIKGEVPASLAEAYAKARQDLIDAASQFDDGVAAAWLAGEEIPGEKLVAGLKLAMRNGSHIPVYMGSALKNVGIRQLMNGINLLSLPDNELMRYPHREGRFLLIGGGLFFTIFACLFFWRLRAGPPPPSSTQ